MITQTYKLDLIPNFAPLVVHVSQYDVGSRTLVFNLTKSGVAYVGSATGATIKGTKPDGSGFMYSMTLDGSTASIVVTEQMTAVAGMTTCEVVLTDGTAVLGSANFTLFVEHTALDSETVISDTDIPIFEELTRQAQEYAQQARESAESIDVSALEAEIASKAPSVSPTLKFAIMASVDGNSNPHAEFRTMGSSPSKSVGFAVYDENGNGTYYDLIKGDGTRYFATVPELALKAPLDSPALTGTPTSTTTAKANNSTRIATTAYVKSNLADYAPLDSPALTGTPTAPTASVGTATTQVASTEFVANELANALYYKSGDTFSTISLINADGMITYGNRNLFFTLSVDKLMSNISSITVTACNGSVRGIGGYINNADNNNYNWLANATVTATKASDRLVRITCSSSTAFTNATVNTPTTFYGTVTLTFA